jgi:hypothetical protein
MKLLTAEISSPKLAKHEVSNYYTAILYLAGAGDTRLCPAATEGCHAVCLVTEAGRGSFDNVKQARQNRTNMLFDRREDFLNILRADIKSVIRKAKKLGKTPAIRLNGGSDLDWTELYTEFSEVQFWEYTKRPDLALKLNKLPNVQATYSHNEYTTSRIMGSMLANGINIAMVFDLWSRKGGDLPASVGSVPVIDGDVHDLRFLDPKGVIVGLRLKSITKPGDKVNLQFVQKGA